MKDIVYQRIAQTREELLVRILHAAKEIKDSRVQLRRAIRVVDNRVAKCMEEDEKFLNILCKLGRQRGNVRAGRTAERVPAANEGASGAARGAPCARLSCSGTQLVLKSFIPAQFNYHFTLPSSALKTSMFKIRPNLSTPLRTVGMSESRRSQCELGRHRTREPSSIPGGVAPRFSYVVIVTEWRCCSAGFLGALPFPRPLHSGAASYSPHFTLIVSHASDVKSCPNLFSHAYPFSDWLLEALGTSLKSDWLRLAAKKFPTGRASGWRHSSGESDFSEYLVFKHQFPCKIGAAEVKWLYCLPPTGFDSREVTHGFSHVGIVPDDDAGWRIFSVISRFPVLRYGCCFILTSLNTHRLSRPGCQESPKSVHTTTLGSVRVCVCACLGDGGQRGPRHSGTSRRQSAHQSVSLCRRYLRRVDIAASAARFPRHLAAERLSTPPTEPFSPPAIQTRLTATPEEQGAPEDKSLHSGTVEDDREAELDEEGDVRCIVCGGSFPDIEQRGRISGGMKTGRKRDSSEKTPILTALFATLFEGTTALGAVPVSLSTTAVALTRATPAPSSPTPRTNAKFPGFTKVGSSREVCGGVVVRLHVTHGEELGSILGRIAPDLHTQKTWRTLQLAEGFSRDTPISCSFTFRHWFLSISLHAPQRLRSKGILNEEKSRWWSGETNRLPPRRTGLDSQRAGGISRGCPVSHAFEFRRCSILT
ncbi:hypothetical protein PR048_006649 [Dryococelus australis]|uniref:Uncharacterized protein n=1 Tax=Dryococelus australis TaxID=614101 RepID=A0ABQ9ICT1_9NEOP|nr:hypothetical protein PR048_006649 [Dryococelus australis]